MFTLRLVAILDLVILWTPGEQLSLALYLKSFSTSLTSTMPILVLLPPNPQSILYLPHIRLTSSKKANNQSNNSNNKCNLYTYKCTLDYWKETPVCDALSAFCVGECLHCSPAYIRQLFRPWQQQRAEGKWPQRRLSSESRDKCMEMSVQVPSLSRLSRIALCSFKWIIM